MAATPNTQAPDGPALLATWDFLVEEVQAGRMRALGANSWHDTLSFDELAALKRAKDLRKVEQAGRRAVAQ